MDEQRAKEAKEIKTSFINKEEKKLLDVLFEALNLCKSLKSFPKSDRTEVALTLNRCQAVVAANILGELAKLNEE